MARIMITGGTGFIGREIVFKLKARGDTPVIVTRNALLAREMFGKNTELETWETIRSGDAMVKIDKVLNLVGEPIGGKRWNESLKKELIHSRVELTRNLVFAMELAEYPPKVLISGSAIGYYGDSNQPGLTEDSPPGNDFLAKLAVDWEEQALRAREFDARVAIIRTGLVLGNTGGALPHMAKLIKYKMGNSIGTGEQWVSWVDIMDIVNLFLFALDNEEASGPINGTSPHPVKMSTLMEEIALTMDKKVWLTVPDFALKLALGEGANMLFSGQHVLPKKARDLGFEFKHQSMLTSLRRYLTTV